MLWSWADSPAKAALAFLFGLAVFGLWAYGDFHDWWR